MKQELKKFNCPVSWLERKAFNLEEALAGQSAGRNLVITRDGRAVTQITKFDDVVVAGEVFAVVDKIVFTFTSLGEYIHDSGSCLDLFMAPEKKWVNLYWNEDKNCVEAGLAYYTEDDANKPYFENGEGRKFIKQISFEI